MTTLPAMLRSLLKTSHHLRTISLQSRSLSRKGGKDIPWVNPVRTCHPFSLSFGAYSNRLQHTQVKETVCIGETQTEPRLDSKRNVEKSAEEILANLDPERAKKLKVIQLEVDMLQQFGGMVPDKILPSWWVSLLDLETSSKRRKYYRYLRKIENSKKSKERKQAQLAQRRAEKEAEETEDRGPRNTIFMHIRKSTMNESHHYKLAHAMMFGPEVIIDLSFDHMMQNRECTNLADQLWFAFGANRQHPEPFHFIFTNAHSNNKTIQALHRSCHDSSLDKMLFTITEKSYLDLYPRERLVYLTPNAKEELTEFNYDDVYIVGGLVDKSNTKPVTMAKAKEENIRMAKFPLDRHLVWCQGTKSLTVDQALRILLDLKMSKDWKSALKHVPQRKVMKKPWKQ